MCSGRVGGWGLGVGGCFGVPSHQLIWVRAKRPTNQEEKVFLQGSVHKPMLAGGYQGFAGWSVFGEGWRLGVWGLWGGR